MLFVGFPLLINPTKLIITWNQVLPKVICWVRKQEVLGNNSLLCSHYLGCHERLAPLTAAETRTTFLSLCVCGWVENQSAKSKFPNEFSSLEIQNIDLVDCWNRFKMLYTIHTLCKPRKDIYIFRKKFIWLAQNYFAGTWCRSQLLHDLWRVVLLQADLLQTSDQGWAGYFQSKGN